MKEQNTNPTTIKNKKTGKIAIIYGYCDEGRQAIIKYLKNGKPFGPLRTVQIKNFTHYTQPEKLHYMSPPPRKLYGKQRP